MNWVSLTQRWKSIQASYWFVPTLMVVAAVLLSITTESLDGWVGNDWPSKVPFLLASRPDGARAVLSAIAGSMITVAGVTFSTTMVSVSFASGQFGPRLIGNFMRDRGNQITLGVFIATFVYCLLTLRSVRSGPVSGEVEAFVPQISILVAIALALSCVGVLIFFIHHVPETINVGRIVANIGEELRREVDLLFPESADSESREDEVEAEQADVEIEAEAWQSSRRLVSNRAGYVQAVDLSALTLYATENELLLRLEFRPGDFVNRGDVLLYASPGDQCSPELIGQLGSHFVTGSERTPHQNALFLADQLVEMMARALSPGVNDPFTAINCIKWLGSALIDIAERGEANAHRYDEDGELRVIVHPVSFERFCASVFDQARAYVASDRNACREMMKMITEAALRASWKPRQETLLAHAAALASAAEERLPLAQDRREIADQLDWVRKAVADPTVRLRLRDDQGWLGGSA